MSMKPQDCEGWKISAVGNALKRAGAHDLEDELEHDLQAVEVEVLLPGDLQGVRQQRAGQGHAVHGLRHLQQPQHHKVALRVHGPGRHGVRDAARQPGCAQHRLALSLTLCTVRSVYDTGLLEDPGCQLGYALLRHISGTDRHGWRVTVWASKAGSRGLPCPAGKPRHK